MVLKNKPGMLAGVGLGGVAVAAMLVLVLTTGSEKSTPEGVAEAAVVAYNANDADGFAEVFCTDAKDKARDLIGEDTIELAEVRTHADGKAVAIITVGTVDEARMILTEENDEWCVASF